jgi:hypothetical protein
MDRMHPAIWALSVLTPLASVRAGTAEPACDQAGKPNIILCTADDQGWGDVSYRGPKKVRTPNRSRLC